MDTNKMCEANRIAWNEAVPILNKNSNINIKELIKNNDYYFLDKAEIKKFKDLSLANKNIAQLCCNNGREVISLVKLGASLGVGFDISDEAIAEAKELAQLAKMNCIFERTNVYDISEKYNNFFDIVYFSAGCFNWIEDLNKLFKVVSRILKSHGKLVIYEMQICLCHMMMLDLVTMNLIEYIIITLITNHMNIIKESIIFQIVFTSHQQCMSFNIHLVTL